MFIYFDEFIAIGLIGFLGAMSPGPDFVIVSQNTLLHGRKAGILTALGVALGCLFHLTYCIIGIGVVVSESIFWFNIIKYFGCAYLLYLGWHALRAKTTTHLQSASINKHHVNYFQLFKKGFLINLLNPKATLFFVSVFSQVIDPKMPKITQACLGAEFVLIAFIWFSMLACILSFPALKAKLNQWQKGFERMMGGALVLLGLKVATVTQG